MSKVPTQGELEGRQKGEEGKKEEKGANAHTKDSKSEQKDVTAVRR